MMLRTSTVLICACRPLGVITFGAAMKLTPWRWSKALITTRNCGSVRMPVIAATAGALFRRPLVRILSVDAGETVAGVTVPGGEPAGSGTGKPPLGFAAQDRPVKL